MKGCRWRGRVTVKARLCGCTACTCEELAEEKICGHCRWGQHKGAPIYGCTVHPLPNAERADAPGLLIYGLDFAGTASLPMPGHPVEMVGRRTRWTDEWLTDTGWVVCTGRQVFDVLEEYDTTPGPTPGPALPEKLDVDAFDPKALRDA